MHELELAGEVRVQAHEVEPAGRPVASLQRVLDRDAGAVGAAPPEEPVVLAHRDGVARAGVRVERVARVGSADVGADRAVQAGWVGSVVPEAVAILEQRVVALGRQYERGAAGPASDQLGRDPRPAIRPLVVGRVLGEAPEGGHVLLELAQHEVAAVPAEVASAAALHVARQHVTRIVVGIHEWTNRVEAIFVPVAEDELSGPDGIVVRMAGASDALQPWL